MCAENVRRLPQSLRDGWRARAERTSQGLRDGRILITDIDQLSGTRYSLVSFLCFDLLSFPFFPFGSSPCTGHQRTPPSPFPFSFLFFSCQYSAKDTRAILELQESEQDLEITQVAHRAMNRLYKSMLAGPAARELV